MTKFEKLALSAVGEDVEPLEILHIDRNANGSAILENSMAVLINLSYNTAIPLLAIYPTERQTSICSHTKIFSCCYAEKVSPAEVRLLRVYRIFPAITKEMYKMLSYPSCLCFLRSFPGDEVQKCQKTLYRLVFQTLGKPPSSS